MSPEIEARRSALMRVFLNSGGGAVGWEALAQWTLDKEARLLDALKQDMLDRRAPFARAL